MKTQTALSVLIWVFAPALLSGQYLSFQDGPATAPENNPVPERIASYQQKSNSYHVTWHFDGAYVSEAIAEGEPYQFLHIEGFSKLHITGSPALPAKTDRIVMPEGAAAEIVITSVSFKEYDGFNIHPALKPARDTEGVPEPEFEIDEKVYGRDAFFPESTVKLTNTYLIRGIPVAMIQTVPVLYNPVTKKIRVYSDISFEVIFNGGKSTYEDIALHHSKDFTSHLKKAVLNSECIPEGKSFDQANRGKSSAKNYIIITHVQYAAQALQLADWKRQLGYSVEIVTGINWTSNLVKTEIKNRYDAWSPKPDYVLILGDHSGAYAVPGEIHQDPYYSDNFATDLYYLCMDGPTDWHPDISGGRISVSSVAEAQVVVDKIINYEKNPVDDAVFYESGLTCAQYQDDDNNGFADRRFCHTSEEINDYLTLGQGYEAEKIYYTSTTADVTALRYNNGYYSYGQLLPAELRNSSFDWKGGAAEITSSINQGRFIVFHRDHGYVGGSGWAHPYYTVTSMNSLSNGDLLPVIFSINCHTGEYQLSNCFAEKLVRMEGKGAVGVVAAAYYSFSGFNDALAEGMIDAIWPDPGLTPQFGAGGTGTGYTCGEQINTMGDVVRQGLYAMEVNWGGSSSSDQYQYELFHWFGDPAMKIWTRNPNEQLIGAVHSAEIDCAGSQFSVSKSIPGATATLVFNNELIAQSTVDESGDAVLNYQMSVPGTTVILTLSKDDHKPYVANLTVTGACSFPPALITYPATGITETGAVLCGEITNDFGETVTHSGFVYSHLPNPVIGDPGVVVIYTNPLQTTGYYEITVSGLLPATFYYLRAFAINPNGTGYGNDIGFTTGETAFTVPYTQDFESAGTWPEGWSTDAATVWSISSNWNGLNNPGGYNVYSDYYPYATGSVFSPVFSGNGKTGLKVKFYHYWKANYSSGTQHGYFYGSRDGGQTFPYLIDEWHHNDPGIEEGEKVYDISSWADGYEGLAFKWVVTHNNDWYWQFDDFALYEEGIHGLWTGNHSTDWNDPGNWHDGMLPDELTDVVVPSDPEGGYFPEINNGQEAVCADLTIEQGARLYIPYDNSMTVNGNLVNLSGADGLVIQSGQGGKTGSLIQNSPGVEASVEQYLTQLNWHLIGIPVQYAEAGVFFLPDQSDIFLNAFIESTGSWGPWIVSVTTPLERGRGYECWVSDNVDQDESVVFQGILNTGDFSTGKGGNFGLSYTEGEGFNLMSNPFPCAIEADVDTWEKRGVSNTVWTWNESEGNYLYWNSTNVNGSNGYGTLSGGVVPPVQGFFVLANGDQPQLTIPSRARAHMDQAFYKEKDIVANSLKIKVFGETFTDAAFITFGVGAAEGFDPAFDSPKMFGYPEAPQLYSVCDGKPVSINTLPDGLMSGSISVPLGFECAVNGVFTLEVLGFESFTGNLPVHLEDQFIGTLIDLRKQPGYTFSHDPDNQPDRFVIHFGEVENNNEMLQSDTRVFGSGNKIFVNTDQHQLMLKIFNVSGSEVFSTQLEGGGRHEIKTYLSPGCYLVKTGCNKYDQTIKLIISR